MEEKLTRTLAVVIALIMTAGLATPLFENTNAGAAYSPVRNSPFRPQCARAVPQRQRTLKHPPFPKSKRGCCKICNSLF